MKTINAFLFPRNVINRVLMAGFALVSPSLYAQTFTGRDYLNESPVSIRAFVYPDARKEAIKIRLENRGAKAVRIRILDENQKPVYDDYVTKLAYYGRFDVSALPYGAYTLELSTQTARHRQGFRLSGPWLGRSSSRHGGSAYGAGQSGCPKPICSEDRVLNEKPPGLYSQVQKASLTVHTLYEHFDCSREIPYHSSRAFFYAIASSVRLEVLNRKRSVS